MAEKDGGALRPKCFGKFDGFDDTLDCGNCKKLWECMDADLEH